MFFAGTGKTLKIFIINTNKHANFSTNCLLFQQPRLKTEGDILLVAKLYFFRGGKISYRKAFLASNGPNVILKRPGVRSTIDKKLLNENYVEFYF